MRRVVGDRTVTEILQLGVKKLQGLKKELMQEVLNSMNLE